MDPANSGQGRTLEAIKYDAGRLDILDQLALPHVTKYISVYTALVFFFS
jgi:methylthioribose-1-phosphate isomerase